ncbi:MAG: hypothetical protein WA728_23190 [Xanthobacteraceae bacterium]
MSAGRRSKNGFTGWQMAKKALDKRSGITGWTIHDLRRSFARGLRVAEALDYRRQGHSYGSPASPESPTEA